MVRAPSCPICDATVAPDTHEKTFPFCSARCRNIDLFRWAEGRYALVEPLTPDKLAEIELREEMEGEDGG